MRSIECYVDCTLSDMGPQGNILQNYFGGPIFFDPGMPQGCFPIFFNAYSDLFRGGKQQQFCRAVPFEFLVPGSRLRDTLSMRDA